MLIKGVEAKIKNLDKVLDSFIEKYLCRVPLRMIVQGKGDYTTEVVATPLINRIVCTVLSPIKSKFIQFSIAGQLIPNIGLNILVVAVIKTSILGTES